MVRNRLSAQVVKEYLQVMLSFDTVDNFILFKSWYSFDL